MKRIQFLVVVVGTLFAAGMFGIRGLDAQKGMAKDRFERTAKDRFERGFTLDSLRGSYASSGRADGFQSRSVGVVMFDGRGGLVRTVRINSSDGSGGRRLIDISSVGTYTMDEDGLGVLELTNALPNGGTADVTFDFVVSKSQRSRRGVRALEVTTIQREPGITASLVEDYLTYREGL